MILSSRPLRFLVAVVGGWVGVRAAMLWPGAVVPALVRAVAPAALAEPLRGFAGPLSAISVVRADLAHPSARHVGRRLVPPTPPTGFQSVGPIPTVVPSPSVAAPMAVLPPDPLPIGADPPPVFRTSRWSGSAWAILRPDGRATPFASQLGGSQAGARLAYAVDAGRRVAVYGRVSTAIDAPEREAAIGVDWRPTRVPVHLVAEQRIGIEGVRSGFALGAVGGVGPTRIAGPLRIEGYAQAGVIFRDGREGFADGSVRLTMPAAKRLDLGLGAWGGAQKGAERLDIGPTVGVTLPVERHALRLSVDWRQRVVGGAKPGSGPAVSLGVDF